MDPDFIPFPFIEYDPADMAERATGLYTELNRRRSLRAFSDRPVSSDLIQTIIMTASTAPSGAHKQPWTFCAVSDPQIKRSIREAAEKEEYENYHGRMSEEWLEDLRPFATHWQKPFLEVAPWLIIVFKKAYDLDKSGQKRKNYYVNESVGLACGLLLTAIHHAGLASLTHTPSPMNFLQQILDRPENERPFLLIPVGYPADDARVPDLDRKRPEDIIVWYKEHPPQPTIL